MINPIQLVAVATVYYVNYINLFMVGGAGAADRRAASYQPWQELLQVWRGHRDLDGRRWKRLDLTKETESRMGSRSPSQSPA
jgi:hypothetical protein